MTTQIRSEWCFLQEAIHLTLALLLLSNCCFGQDTTKATVVDSLLLEELTGFSQTFYFSPSYEARTRAIAEFLENAVSFFQTEIGFTPKTKFFVLAPQHWKYVAAKPLRDVYGFPHNIDHVRLAIAAEDNDFARSFLPPVDKLPAPILARVKQAYGNADGSYSMMPFFDLLALHEMGHSYTAQAGLKMQRHWMSELFVNIMLHTFIAEKQSALLTALETFPGLVVGAGSNEYKFTSLEDFEKLYATLGMGPKNYGWYQCKLHTAAKHIYEAGGKTVLKKLWQALKNHQEKMTDEELVSMLKKEVHSSVAATYLDWNN